jgi:uncharacterized repeat protein (TIGR01451 family)
MRRILMVLASAVGMALLACGVAAADTVETDFETFNLGTVDGQDGWHSAVPGDIPGLPLGYDQAVVSSGGVSGFGTKSLRHSNALSEPTGEFQFQTYSKSTTASAGEDEPNTEYIGEFQFTSTQAAQQEDLYMRISPDDGVGGRMSFVGLRDTAAGIQATIFDTPEVDGEFAPYDAGTYSRTEVHTVRFWIKLVPGADNDIVRIFIDGVDIGRKLGVCFTTWENFYRATQQPVPAINSIEFRVQGRGGPDGVEFPDLLGGGYLFDNVTTTTATGAGPGAGCNLDVDKEADARTVSAGGLAGYRITVRNRGRAIASNVRVCDRIPRGMMFVSADRRLGRSGGQRCLVIPRLRPGQPVSFHIVLQVDADAPPGTVTNIAEITPKPPAAPIADTDVPGAIVKAKATARARAIVRVVARAAQRRLPPVTG